MHICFSLNFFLLMGTNLQESADWYKLRNDILDIKGNIILYEVTVDDSLVPRTFHHKSLVSLLSL